MSSPRKRAPKRKSSPKLGGAIVPQEYVEAPIDSIAPHPRNANAGDVDDIEESIDENGFYGAVLVQKSSRLILFGEHRWQALKRKGSATIPIILADVDDATALRILLVDNASAEKGMRAPEKLADIFKLIGGSGKWKGTGYKKTDIDAVLRMSRPEHPALKKGSRKEYDALGTPDEAMPEPDDAEPTRPPEKARHALPIVLTNAERRLWESAKAKVGEKDDKKALLALAEQAVGS